MKVEIKEKGIIDEEKQIYRTETYLKNMFVGNVRMMDHIYELEDINVQYGACDVEIDLTTYDSRRGNGNCYSGCRW